MPQHHDGFTAQAAVPVLPSGDVAASLSLLEQVFGFDTWTQDDPPTYGGARLADVELHVYRTEDRALCESVSCRLNVRGVRAAHEAARAAGCVHPNGELEEKPWGFLEFSMLLPWGACIAVGEDLDPDDGSG